MGSFQSQKFHRFFFFKISINGQPTTNTWNSHTFFRQFYEPENHHYDMKNTTLAISGCPEALLFKSGCFDPSRTALTVQMKLVVQLCQSYLESNLGIVEG